MFWDYFKKPRLPKSMNERKADPVEFIENKMMMKRLLINYTYKNDIES